MENKVDYLAVLYRAPYSQHTKKHPDAPSTPDCYNLLLKSYLQLTFNDKPITPMPKKPSSIDSLSITRCKRIIRPLISKIATLTDLYIKYPSKFDLDLESFEIVQKNHGRSTNFISPSSSSDRILSLKPYLNPELYQAYVEIFTIFKTIVLAWQVNLKEVPKVAKLSTLASLKVGKCIALGTKSSHYRLSQTALFDSDSIPKYLQKYHDELSDDIDDWLVMEPLSVVKVHRVDLLYGYLLHLLVFNLRTIFYCLIPVLVHWLQEQSSYYLGALLRSLLVEYFMFLPVDSDQRAVAELTTEVVLHDPSLPVFWLFHNIGYWKSLCGICKLNSIESSAPSFMPYDSIFLDILAKTDRLCLTDGIDLQQIYDTLQRNPQHPHSTTIMTSILAQIISLFKKSLKKATTSKATLTVFQAIVNDITDFVRTWLSFSSDCVFNSFDGGNEEAFEALLGIVTYSQNHCSRVVDYLNELQLKKKRRAIEELIEDFTKTLSKIEELKINVSVLRAFYLDKSEYFNFESVKLADVSRSMSALMGHNCEHNEIVDFLIWLRDLDGCNGHKISKAFFKQFFQKDLVLGEVDYEDLAWNLYDL